MESCCQGFVTNIIDIYRDNVRIRLIEMFKEGRTKVFQLHADFCKAFCHPTRLRILDLLRHGRMSVKELQEQLGVRQTIISQHLAILRNVNAVKGERSGRSVYYRITDPRIIEAYDIIDRVIREARVREAKILAK